MKFEMENDSVPNNSRVRPENAAVKLQGRAGDPGVSSSRQDVSDAKSVAASHDVSSCEAGHPLPGMPLRFEITPVPDSITEQSSDERVGQIASQPSPVAYSAPVFSTPPANSLKLPPILEYASAMAHLATFGILGVRFQDLCRLPVSLPCVHQIWLGVTFGRDHLRGTLNESILFNDLPANMVGCFFMGWVGVVLKKDIALFSELLVIGLSTGLMGSITTYAGWNQEMLSMVTRGMWVRAIFSLILGMQLPQMSLLVGMDSAKLLKSLVCQTQQARVHKGLQKLPLLSPDDVWRRKFSLKFFLVLSISLWVAAIALTVIDVDNIVRRRLWLACVVAPPGVWARWLLARLNGQGIGSKRYLKWLPVGTFLTNFVACTLEATLALVQILVPETEAALLVQGLHLGLLGCMSTVSTFVTEIFSLHQSTKQWHAYAYAGIMLSCCFTTGLLIYSLPIWTRHYGLPV